MYNIQMHCHILHTMYNVNRTMYLNCLSDTNVILMYNINTAIQEQSLSTLRSKQNNTKFNLLQNTNQQKTNLKHKNNTNPPNPHKQTKNKP